MSADSAAEWHEDSEVPKIELLEACYRNDRKTVAQSLRNGVHVDSTDDDLVTPLQIAAFMGNCELARLLLDSQANLEAASSTGMTPFLHACREGKMEVIDLFLQKGADIRKLTRLGASALTMAAAGGHLEVVKKLVGLQVPVSASKDICPTPLITSVYRNFSPIAVYLIDKGAPIDAMMDNLQWLSALSCGVIFSTRSMLITLMDKGADPYRKKFMKKTDIELAIYLKRRDAANLFHDRYHGKQTKRKDIRQALMDDDYDKEELLQQRKLRLPSGCTPLHFSVAIGNIHAVRLLVAERQLLDDGGEKFGISALQIAALLGQADVINCLLDSGASTAFLNQHKMTAFDYYIANGGESSGTLRSALHCFKPPKKTEKIDFMSSGSSGTGTLKRIPEKVGLFSRKLFAEKTKELPPVEAKQWRETRMHTYPMHGRNYRKFVTCEEILHRERALFPKNTNDDDSVIEVVRALATEAQSFLVTNFYDWYTAGAEKRPSRVDRSKKEYDQAIANSILYSYPKSQPPKQQPTVPTENFDAFKRLSRYSETSSPNQSRQTPRMLKKSKDTLLVEGEKHELRKSLSTGQLQAPRVVSPRVVPMTMSAYSPSDPTRAFLQDLERRGRGDVVARLREEELEGFQMLTFSEQEFRNIRITDPKALALLRELQMKYPMFHSSNH